MSVFADIVCTVADLVQTVVKYEAKSLVAKVEEQTQAVKCGIRSLCVWCGFLMLSLLLLLAGVVLIIWGFYALLAMTISPGASALVVGVIVSLLATILFVIVKSSVR